MGQAARGEVAGARWSLRLGVDPNEPSRSGFRHENLGQTPLTAAAQFGHVEVARLVLSKGDDPNIPNSPQLVGDGANWTALDWALQAKQPAVGDLLRQRGGVENRRR